MIFQNSRLIHDNWVNETPFRHQLTDQLMITKLTDQLKQVANMFQESFMSMEAKVRVLFIFHATIL